MGVQMSLREKRVLFTRLLAEHISWLFGCGFEVALDEATERLTERDQQSDHSPRSLHHSGLAADLILYKSGKYLSRTEDHLESGKKWESRHELCRWGGRFKDGNHYSLEHEGRK